jgi:hypothetical protein
MILESEEVEPEPIPLALVTTLPFIEPAAPPVPLTLALALTRDATLLSRYLPLALDEGRSPIRSSRLLPFPFLVLIASRWREDGAAGVAGSNGSNGGNGGGGSDGEAYD